MSLADLSTPCFVVDGDKVKKNCLEMRQRCEELGVKLRPHMKTHKTLEAGELMTNGSKQCIVVSTVMEAEFYAAAGFNDILYAYMFTKDKLPRLKKAGIACPSIGIGSTPSCSLPGKDMAKLTEFHPGNYVFYDMQQVEIGSCKKKNIAARVATRVIGHYPGNKQMLVDCGFLGISHDGAGKLANGAYCLIDGHPELSFVKMTQEVGVIRSSDENKNIDFDKFPVGSMIFLLPYHACSTAAMHPVYHIHKGQEVTGTWTPCRGW